MSDEPDTLAGEAAAAVDRDDAEAAHTADREPTPDEARAAESNPPLDPSVAEHYEEMAETGANVKGEGQIEP